MKYAEPDLCQIMIAARDRTPITLCGVTFTPEPRPDGTKLPPDLAADIVRAAAEAVGITTEILYAAAALRFVGDEAR
jgi:hypothetical protein